MSLFAFRTDAESEQYCHKIVTAMIRDCGVSEQEALQRINMFWARFPFLGMDLRYHDLPERWAKHLFYGKEQFWWLDERGLQSWPLEPAETLGIRRSSHRTTILGALDHPDTEVRAWAANVLGHERDEALDDLVNRALSHTLQHDAHSRVRYWAAYALGNRSYDHFTVVIQPALCAALTDPERGVRAQAANGLGRRKEARSVAPLLEALHDVEGCVRWRVAESLGNLGEIRAVPALITALQDREDLVCGAALRALGRLGDEQALQPLLDRLDRLEQSEERSLLGSLLVGALLHFGLPVLLPMLDRLSSDKSEIRGIAAEVLGSLKEERAFSPLMRVMQEDPVPRVRFEAYKSLLRLGYRDTDPGNETIR